MASHLGQPFVNDYVSKKSLVILSPLGTGSDVEGPDGGSVLLGGFTRMSWVITPKVWFQSDVHYYYDPNHVYTTLVSTSTI